MKRMAKLLILSLILSISFTTYSNVAYATTAGPPSTSQNHVTLGSQKYISKIKHTAGLYGYKIALAEMIADVDKYGSDLDKNNFENNLRLYRFVSFVVDKIGFVDVKTHYFRNKLNRSPKTLAQMIAMNKALPPEKRWTLLSVINSAYHMQGASGEYNLKFISREGFCEAVYNKDGILLSESNDPHNMGTFNYSPGIKALNAHSKYDVEPYLIWGNAPDIALREITTISAVNLGTINCKAHELDIFNYRKSLFGIQSGWSI